MQTIHKRSGFTLIELLVVIAICSILMGLLLAAVQRARAIALRSECSSKLRQIGLALHQYHDSHRVLPPGCASLKSMEPYPFLAWSARILPYIEQEALWKGVQDAFAQEKDFRLNPPHMGLTTVVSLFLCPADGRRESPWAALLGYLGVEGTDFRARDGVLFLDSRIRFGDVIDGLSSTLLAGERPPSARLNFGWWYAGWGQNQTGSADMVLGVRELREPSATFSAGCPDGPYTFQPGDLGNQCDAFHFWSLHTGGAHFLFVDGSVRFLSYSAEPILAALATRGGQEVVSELQY